MQPGLLMSFVLLCAPAHCGEENFMMTWEGEDFRYDPILIYHHELYRGSGFLNNRTGQGRLICSGLHPVRGHWYFPNGELVNKKLNTSRDFYQRYAFVTGNRSVSRVSRLNDFDSERTDPRVNGLWQCRFTLSDHLLPVSFHVGMYSRGMGAITYINCLFTFTNQEASRAQLHCTTSGGPPTTYVWRYNGRDITRNREVLRDWAAVNLTTSNSSIFSGTYQQITTLSNYTCVLSLSGYFPGEFEYAASNRAMTKNITERILIQELYADPSSTSAVISWPYLNINEGDNYIVVLSRVTGPGQELCPNIEDTRSLTTSQQSTFFGNLEEYSNYTVTVSSSLIPRISLTFATLSTAPTSAPQNLVHTITSRSVGVRWDAVDCIDLNGPFLGYEVDFRRADGAGTSIGEVRGMTFMADGLEPGSLYIFKVAVFNRAGRGPFSSILRLVLDEEAVPGAVSNLNVEIVDFSTVLMSWSPPEEPNGVLIAYEVAYTINGKLPIMINITETSDTTYSLSGLGIGTIISDFSVRAYTNAGPGAIVSLSGAKGIISIIEPTIVPNVRVTLIPETTSVRVEWDSINTTGLLNYIVVYYSSNNANKQSVTVPSTQNFAVIENLDEDQVYMFEVVGIGTVNTQELIGRMIDANGKTSFYIPCEDCFPSTALAVGTIFCFAIVLLITILLIIYIKSQKKVVIKRKKYESHCRNNKTYDYTSSEDMNMEPIEEPELPEQDYDYLTVPE